MTRVVVNGRELRILFDHKSQHFNYFNTKSMKTEKMTYHKGTRCKIYEGEKLIAYGVTNLNPIDNFCRRTGIKLSLSRALEWLELDKDSRRVIWNAVLKMGKVQTEQGESKCGSDKQQLSICDDAQNEIVAVSKVAECNTGLRTKSQRFGDFLLRALGKGFQEGHE